MRHRCSFDGGRETEENTFVSDEGLEPGVPPHYFSEEEVGSLFGAFRICILAEVVVTYVETEPEFYKRNPFPYTKWNLLAGKDA